ncbi:MAG TPA: ROK family protein [Pyrinomonadaceae bacterium]|nr:ROK family protein [Pyrinomonadaceae bacterium]
MSEIRNQNAKLVGVEVSKTAFYAVSLNENGEVINNLKIAVESGQEPIRQLVNFIEEAKNKFGGFDKAGLSLPGLLHRRTNRIAFSTNIPEHEKTDFLSEAENATGVKITAENDANAAAYAEFKQGAGRGVTDMFYATIGAGIGGAFIFNGEIWEGASGFAGEFGQLALNSEGMRLEEVASAANIVRRTRNRFHQDSTSSLNNLAEEKITLSDVIQAARNQDDFARMMLDRTGTYVGAAIAGVINLLNIERIVVGGEIMQAGELVLDSMIRRARELSFTPAFKGTEIVRGELGDEAAATGAALLSVR